MYSTLVLKVEYEDVTIKSILLWIADILQFANSLVNSIVYSYRMPMFKATMKKLFKNRANSN